VHSALPIRLWQAVVRVASLEIAVNPTLEALEAEAMKLAPSDRSHLVERLIASLDADPDVEGAWEREADRREEALDSGSVVEVPGPEAMNRLRSGLVP
jgi:putative addiction module component (TIGR02574 family)